MSSSEQVFLDVALTPLQAARELAGVLDLELLVSPNGVLVLRSDTVSGLDGDVGQVGGVIEANDLALPEFRTEFDPYPLMWDVRCVRPGDGYDLQRRAARRIFDHVVQRLGWPALLVHNLELVVAAWDPVRGLREFAPFTTAGGEDAATWS